ncbi:trigger factor, partial [Candidatus Peregrinibacteria bacterium]|nr:trigger factor [Candidatus Peregrinibacteria bacterium]
PMDQVKDKVDSDKLFQQTIHHLLPTTFEKLIESDNIKPIIHPRVEAVSQSPLTVKIIFVEKPEVKIKGIDKIKIEKKEPEVDEKEMNKMIDYILAKHKKIIPVEREAKSGDQVTMDFWGSDKEDKEIDGIRTEGHIVEIGSKVLIPGFEDALIGMKKGEEKAFTLTFPEKYHAEQLQNQPVTFHVTVKDIAEINMPELNDEFAQKELQSKDVADFKKQISDSMLQQEITVEHQRRERILMDEIVKCTTVELAEELISEETKQMVGEFSQQLQQQGMTMETWMTQSGKKAEEVMEDMKEQSTTRLKLRLGMQKLIDEKNIDISDEEMDMVIEEFLSQATPEQKVEVESSYKKGAQAYEQLKWQKNVEKALSEMLK